MTLAEAIMAIAVVGIAGTALLMSVASSIDVTDQGLEQMMAQGLASQLMDEIGKTYCEPGSSATGTLGLDSGELSGNSRSNYDDIDDYQGLTEQPPRDRWGVEIGRGSSSALERHAGFCTRSGAFSPYRRTTQINYVSASDFTTVLSGGQTSNYRAVEVRVFVDGPGSRTREVVKLRRVFAYVPTL